MSQAEAPAPRSMFSAATLPRDLTGGVVVFLVALPLCLGIALASGAPLFSGLLAGIIGGIVIGSISGSHTSVSGPAAGLTAIVAAQLAALGSFEAFLFAVLIGGILQIALGVLRAGSLSAFFPSSVIKGLLAAIGVILILKQIPHLVGHDSDPEGDMAFTQPDKHNTFSELGTLFEGSIHSGAAAIGITCLLLLIFWERCKPLKNSIVPGPLVIVLVGVAMQVLLRQFGGQWVVGADHLVKIPVAQSFQESLSFLTFPDFSQWRNPAVYVGGVTIAIVASLETLLNLEAVDKLDPEKRNSPSSRELVAQGIGNCVAGMIGGLPTTSVIVRSSVNVSVGAKTKLSAIFHGILLLISVLFFPQLLNMIPLSALAAILLVTGFKLASPKLFAQIWRDGPYQFLPFVITLTSIVLTDLLIGILIGLGVSVIFILRSNLRRPVRRIVEAHLGGDVLHIELANQVSFLNKASLTKVFDEVRPGTNVLIDATETDYMDPDILTLIREFRDEIGPAREVSVSLRGFRQQYRILDEIQFADYSTRELQDQVSPLQVLEILIEGNRRFHTGHRLSRDFNRQVTATAKGQSPLAVVFGCIDSRVPTELVFDVGIGDIFSVRVAGNVIGSQPLASIEYGVKVAGAKVVVVLGHTRCGAVTSSVELLATDDDIEHSTGCAHLPSIVNEIGESVTRSECRRASAMSAEEREEFIDEVAKRNVLRSVDEVVARSEAVRNAIKAGQLLVIGALYDVASGEIVFLQERIHPQDLLAQQ